MKNLYSLLLMLILKMNWKLEIFIFVITPSINLDSYMKPFTFSHISEMIIKTISDIKKMTYKLYLDNPMPMIKKRLNIMISRNPNLINLFNRHQNHPLVRKSSHVSFEQNQIFEQKVGR